MLSISTQDQIDPVYLDLSNAFDVVSHNVLLHKLSDFGIYSSFVDWRHSYLDIEHSFVSISGMI
jgi:hypothetical protein